MISGRQRGLRTDRLWLSNDGQRLLDDFGWVFNASTLEFETQLAVESGITAALWLADGRLFMVEAPAPEVHESRVIVFGAGGEQLSAVTYPGKPLRVIDRPDGVVLFH